MVKKNNNNDLKNDTLDLKSHLDASFDYDNIKVSEELIKKTLEAIKSSSNQEEIKVEDTKVTPFKKKKNNVWVYTRRVAAAAAVFVLFVAAYRFIDGGLGVGKKSTENSSVMESAKDEVSILNKAESDSSFSDDFGITSIETVEGSDITATEEEKMSISSDAADMNKQDNSLTMLATSTFSSIYSINPEQVTELTIESKDGSIKKPGDVKETARAIVDLLDEQELTVTNIENPIWSYKIMLLTDDNGRFTILIGDGIHIQMGDDTPVNSYMVDDIEGLISKLDELCNTMP